MPDLLIPGINPEVYDRMRKAANAQGKSLEQIACEALDEKFRPSKERSKEELWAEVDRFRKRIGPLDGDSTEFIREWRDNDEPYR